MFINEPGKGIHIFNNVDPSKPQAMAFLSIPDNVDLAILDGKLCADSYPGYGTAQIDKKYDLDRFTLQVGFGF